MTTHPWNRQHAVIAIIAVLGSFAVLQGAAAVPISFPSDVQAPDTGAIRAPEAHLVSRGGDLQAHFSPRGVAFGARGGADWKLNLSPSALQRGTSLQDALPVEPRTEGARVVFTHPWGTEWYVAHSRGIEQGFDLRERPAGSGPVRLLARVEGLTARSASRGRVVFATGDEGTLEVRDLRVYDARGRQLEHTSMEWDGRMLALVFDDTGYDYPLVVDPLWTTWRWEINGENGSSQLGRSVASAGDVNGDGYADVIVGAIGAGLTETGSSSWEGKAYVYHGSPSGLSAVAMWSASAGQPSAFFGASVAGAGDVNGDGYDDVIVGVPYWDNGQMNEGRALLYRGSASGLEPTPSWAVESDREKGVLGTAVASAGDVNGDGFADVIVGVDGCRLVGNDGDPGWAYVYYGSPGGLPAAPSWIGTGPHARSCFGSSVASAGDVNGDGYSDVIVGAYESDTAAGSDVGRAYVFLGSAGGLSPTPAWTADGRQGVYGFGYAVSSAGDVNGDGYSDVIVGEEHGSTARLYLGSAAGLRATPDWTVSGKAGTAYGAAVASAGDLDGDGFDDVIVGAPDWYSDEEWDLGRVYIYRGSPTGLSETASWTAEGQVSPELLGRSVAGAGDVNRDGYPDVIVGASAHDYVANRLYGRALLFFGGADPRPAVWITSPAAGTVITPANQSAFTLAGSCSEPGRVVSVSGAATATPVCSSAKSWIATLDLTGVSDGPLTFTVNHQDPGGAAAAPDSRNFIKEAGGLSIRLSGPASPTRPGTAHDLRVEVVNSAGAVATNFVGTITLTSSDPDAQLPGPVAFQAADSGVRQLPGAVVFWTVGTQSLHAVEQTNGAIAGDLTGIIVEESSELLIIREANLRGAVGIPYRYSAHGRVRAVGTSAMTTFGSCGGPSDFAVEPTSGYVSWTPTVAGAQSVCVSAEHPGARDEYTFIVDVAATAPPGPTARMTATPVSGEAPLSVRFDGSSSSGDPTALPLMYAWDFGEGSLPEAGVQVEHVYEKTGIYRPTLTVYDVFGNSSSISETITLQRPTSGTDGAGLRRLKVGLGCAVGQGGGAWLSLGLAGLLVLAIKTRKAARGGRQVQGPP